MRRGKNGGGLFSGKSGSVIDGIRESDVLKGGCIKLSVFVVGERS